MFPQQTRKTQQPQRIFKGEILRLLTLRKRRALGLGILITDLTPLNIRAVLAEEEIHQISSFRIFSNGFWPISLLLEDEFRLILIQIRWRDFLRQRCLDQLLFPVVADPLGLQISPETANANNGGKTLQIDGSGGTRIDVSLPLLHLGL